MRGVALCVALDLLAVSGTVTSGAAAAEPRLKLEVIGPAKGPAIVEEIRLDVILSTDGDQTYEFQLGAFPQTFACLPSVL